MDARTHMVLLTALAVQAAGAGCYASHERWDEDALGVGHVVDTEAPGARHVGVISLTTTYRERAPDDGSGRAEEALDAVFQGTDSAEPEELINAGVRSMEGRGCSLRRVGPCEVSVCGAHPDGLVHGLPGYVDAGNVRVESAAVSFDAVELSADVAPSYSRILEASWAPGADRTVVMEESGGAVPFLRATLRAPLPIVIDSTPFPAVGRPVVHRADGIPIDWHGEHEGSVEILFMSLADVTAPPVMMRCTYAASAGTALVPPEAFDDFAPGGLAIEIASVSRDELRRDDWSVTFVSQTRPRSPSGAFRELLGATID